MGIWTPACRGKMLSAAAAVFQSIFVGGSGAEFLHCANPVQQHYKILPV